MATILQEGNDSVDFRRELFYGLSMLPVPDRLEFVKWAAYTFNIQKRGREHVKPGDVVVKVSDKTGGEVQEAYSDICILVFDGLDIDVLMRGLSACRKRLAK